MRHAANARPRDPELRQTFVAKAIYGLVTVLAVLVVLGNHPPSAWHAVATLFGTTLAVALLDVYADVIAGTLALQRVPSRAESRAIWRHAAPVLTGAQAPTVVLLLAAFGLIGVARAITIAEVLAALLLFGYGWRIGQRLGHSPLRQLSSGLFVVAIGGLVVGIKVLFH